MNFLCDINIFYRFGKHVLEDLLEPYQVDMHGLIAILSMDEVPGVTQSGLGINIQMDKGNLTKFLQHLEAKGLMYREVSPENKRNKHCYLTEEGKKLAPKLKRVIKKWTALCLEDISAEELELYKKVSSQITKNLLKLGGDGS